MRGIKTIIFVFALLAMFWQCDNAHNKKELVIFHAGSLSVPFREIANAYMAENPDVRVLCEAAGSVDCARKIIDLNRSCDVLASADMQVIDRYLIPDYTDMNIAFAQNQMVLAYTKKSLAADSVSSDNWTRILQNPDVLFGRSDPHSDPCGYRTEFVFQLQTLIDPNFNYYDILNRNRKYIRPKETDLLALLESHVIDYMMIYQSVAMQHGLEFVSLNDSVNLADKNLNQWYANASRYIRGKNPSDSVKIIARSMTYGLCVPLKSENPELANDFLQFFFHPQKGLKIIEQNGQSSIYPKPENINQLKLNPQLYEKN